MISCWNCDAFCVAVLISLSSGMPNHSASIQVGSPRSRPSSGHNPSTPVTFCRWSSFKHLNTTENFSLFGSAGFVEQKSRWCGKVDGDVNASGFVFCSAFLPQLCVQKLRILIEDSDQNCEPSVNACSVSFSHCLRVSVYGTVHPFRRHGIRSPDPG